VETNLGGLAVNMVEC